MSAPNENDGGGDTPAPLAEKTFTITAEALEVHANQSRHLLDVGNTYGFESPFYIAEVTSFLACLLKVFRFDHGATARITAFTDSDDGLSLSVSESTGIVFGMNFHPNRSVKEHRPGVTPGEYSLNS